MADIMESNKFEVASRMSTDDLQGVYNYMDNMYEPRYEPVMAKIRSVMKERGVGPEFSRKYDVVEVAPGVLKDYAGMNWHAAKAMGFDGFPIKRNQVLVDKRLCPMHRKRVIKHEEYEDKHMAKGMKYWDAHLGALKHEV
jgi:hypothetical protein